MAKQKSTSAIGKWIALVSFLLVLVLVAVGFGVVQLAQFTTQDQQARQTLAELRADSLAIVANSQDAMLGQSEAFLSLAQASSSLSQNAQSLNSSLLASQGVTIDASKLSLMMTHSSQISDAANLLDANQETILFLHQIARQLNETIPVMQQEYSAVVEELLDTGADAQQVALAQAQSWRAERIVRNVEKMLAGSADANEAADQFNYDASLFGQILLGQLEGSVAMGIAPVEDEFARESLEAVLDAFAFVEGSVDDIFSATPILLESRDAELMVLEVSPMFQSDLDAISTEIEELKESRPVNQQVVTIGAGVAVVLMLLIAFLFNRRSAARTNAVQEENTKNQNAILRLLDELQDLAEGDLTTSATVSEDFTGTIADMINFTIDELRQLVSRINETAARVNEAAQTTRSSALSLADASDHQAQEIAGASAAVNEMAVTIDQVSANAAESAGVAERSVSIAANGAEIVQQTISGMDNIREQIQESSKRIKRLGESSQEIGDIVSLINDIADQTNILALNAAIQASMAGEAGRGFAVVADEVQRLAERSANATKQIETLVKTIQSDTNEAVVSMEQTTAEVVNGAALAERAGVALEEIETVSSSLAELIQNISNAARQQAASAGHISTTMNVIQEITVQTSQGTSDAADAIGQLAEMAIELQDSVAGFKLPEESSDIDDEEMIESDLEALDDIASDDIVEESRTPTAS
ncbi:MAG: methyl-accepting chemotaxis protein [Gammaproteobacteria bacterium]|nr:methyl-accepting chemotaxis protein [Gammaproteobacteria bacterium]